MAAIPFGPFGEAQLGQQSDGRVILVVPSGGTFSLARYDTNGDLDLDFGSGGVAMPAVVPAPSGAIRVAVQKDDRIVAVGATASGGLVVARYLPDGMLDDSFGVAGTFAMDLNPSKLDFPWAIAVQDDEKVVIGVEFQTAPYSFSSPFWLVRYAPDGTPDTSFDSDGIVVTSFGPTAEWERVRAVLVQPDERIVAGGQTSSATETRFGALARYESTGQLDTTFGPGGKVTHSFAEVSALALQADGKLVVAGHSGYRLRRYLATGHPDPEFGDSGRADTEPGDAVQAYTPSAAFVRSDGRIVTVGEGLLSGSGERYLAVTMNEPDGSITRTFRYSGANLPIYADPYFGSEAAAVMQPDGKIVVAAEGGIGRILTGLCRDGVREGCEECDDGNATEFDGCGLNCRVGAGWTCSGDRPSTCQLAPTTTTVIPLSTTSSTTTTGSGSTTTSTSTLPSVTGCASASCFASQTLANPACLGVPVPSSVRNKLETAAATASQVGDTTGKAQVKLVKRVKRTLAIAKRKARQLSRGKRPKLDPDCANAIQSGITAAEGAVAAGRF